MLYDEKFERELTEYHDSINYDYDGTDTDTNEIIFPFDDKYSCNVCLDFGMTIKNMCIEIEMSNVNEFMDEYNHKLLDGSIIISFNTAYLYVIGINCLLVYNIHRNKKGYEITNDKLRISIYCINGTLMSYKEFKILLDRLTFIDIDHKNISAIISISNVTNKAVDVVHVFYKISCGISPNGMHRMIRFDDKIVYCGYYHNRNIKNLKYIYIIVNYTENEIDFIESVSLIGFGKFHEIGYNDLHKYHISENISIIMIDTIDIYNIEKVLVCMNGNSSGRNINFKTIYLSE